MPPTLPRDVPPPTRLQSWLVSPLVNNGILTPIIINAVILGLETSPAAMRAWGPALLALDQAILAVFVVEIALRVLRILTIVPLMRRVVGGLLAAIPGLSSIAVVLGLLICVFAVIATNLFGADFPAWFGTLGASLYTLFQVMTLESWSMGIVRPVMELHPFAWTFFIPFVLLATFTMLNLFIGVIVSAMQSFTDADLHREMRALRSEIAEVRALLRQPRP